jgi:hypothetical protein
MVVKGRSRDTAWYAMTDDEWPAIRRGCEQWLAPQNFDAGRQRHALAELIVAARGWTHARPERTKALKRG